jgi:hypothetical protein
VTDEQFEVEALRILVELIDKLNRGHSTESIHARGAEIVKGIRERVAREAAELCNAEAQLMGSYEGKQAARLRDAILARFGLDPKPAAEGE